LLNQLWLLQKIKPCTFLDSASEIRVPLKIASQKFLVQNSGNKKLTVLYGQKMGHSRYHHSKIVQTCRQSLKFNVKSATAPKVPKT